MWKVSLVMLSFWFFFNCVKWCTFMLGDAFIFYLSLRGSCTVIVQNGWMSHLIISNIFTLNQIFIALIHAVLYLIRWAAPTPLLWQFMKSRFCLERVRNGGGSWLWLLILAAEIPCRCVLCLLCKYWQALLWVWVIYSLKNLLKLRGFLCISINRNSRYNYKGRMWDVGL